MPQQTFTRHCRGLIVATILLGCPSSAQSQAWTPARGDGTVSVQVQDAFVKYHELPTIRLDRGHIRSQTVMIDFTYGINDRVAVSASLPYVASKYHGSRPHASALDDGSYHATFQDFQFDIRYNLTRRRLVVTPFASAIIPSHAYEYFAHSAPGRDLRELQVGTYWAKLLDPVLPGLFLQGRYSYGFTQRILGIFHDRSNLELQ